MDAELEYDNLRSRAVSGAKWSGTSVAYTTVVHFITTAILARLLSPSDFGLMGMMFIVTGLIAFFSDVSVSGGIIAYQDTTKEQLSSLYWLNIITGIVLFGCIFILRPAAVIFFKEPRISIYLPWVAISLLISPLGKQFAVLLQKQLRFRTLSRIEMTSVTIASIGAIILALLGFGIWSLVFRSVTLSALTSFFCLVVAVQYKWLPSFQFRLREVKHYLSFGLFETGTGFFSYIFTHVDHIIIGRLLGTDALGFYTLAWSLINAPTAKINPVITRVAFPTFARIQHDDDRLCRGYLKILRYVSTYSFPIMAGLFVVAPILIPVVYGPKWQQVVPIVQVLCVLGAMRSIGNPLGTLFMAKVRVDLLFYWIMFASIMILIANLIGVKWGIIGVAWSNVIVVVLITWPIQFYIRWYLIKMKARDYFDSLKIPAVASGLMMILLWCVRPLSNQGNSASSLIFQITAGSVFYLLLNWIFARPFCLELKEAIFHKS